MSVLATAPLSWILPLVVLIFALGIGPLPIVARGIVRGLSGPKAARRFYRPVTLGLGLGLAGTVALVAILDHKLTLGAALLCLLFLLGSIDWQWRWLPIEWTLAVIALAVIYAFQSSDPLQVVVQMLVPAGALLLARQTLLWSIKKEALGLGDIWLVAGLGAFLAPFESFLLIGFAAALGLLEIGVRRLIGQRDVVQLGVSYGTHLCIIFVILRNLTSLA